MRRKSAVSHILFDINTTQLIVQKENNYSIGSGGDITCARLGFDNYQILAAGDDQKNVIVWKITNTKPRLVSAYNLVVKIYLF